MHASKTERHDDLKQKWEKAKRMLNKYGEEHPPVIIINAWKKQQ